MPDLMRHYESADYITRLKTKFFLSMSCVILISLPLIMSYSGIDIPDTAKSFNLPLIILEAVTLALVAAIAYLLYRGHLTLATNTLLPFTLTLTWTGMLLDQSHTVSSLDSVVWILALMGMSPLAVKRNKHVILYYTLGNLAALAIFAYAQTSRPDLPSYAIRDFLLDTGLAMIFIGITSYNVFAINHSALTRTQADVAARKQAEQELALQNALLKSQSEASVDGIIFVDANRRLISCNSRFIKLWNIPPEIVATSSDIRLLSFAEQFLADPQHFRTKTESIYSQTSLPSHDEFELVNGQVFDRYSEPVSDTDGTYLGRVWFMRDITERRLYEEHLRASEERYRAVVEDQTELIIRFAPNGIITFANTSAQRYLKTLGAGNKIPTINEFNLSKEDFQLSNSEPCRLTNRMNNETVKQYMDNAGVTIWCTWTVRPLLDTNGGVSEYQAVGRDITQSKLAEQEKQRLTEDLLQAQKMESIGRMAGGIAHDFNNLLTAIGGNIELAQLAIANGKSADSYLTEGHNAIGSASSLTRQLLAFSRKQAIVPQPVDLNQLITETSSLLRRVIGEQIALETSLRAESPVIKIDSSQIEQIIMNLAVNARDAMPHGGRLTISTANIDPNNDSAKLSDASQQNLYMELTVSDTGCGMDQHTIEHIFEPFFTTKPAGSGTGLGLATTYGSVVQNGGNIKVQSIPGQGSTFKITLPTIHEAACKQCTPTPSAALPGGNESILLVEDDLHVRTSVSNILRHIGYQVCACSSGEECLMLPETVIANANVIMTDIVLPGIDGQALSCEISRRNPQIKTLFTSGYDAEQVARQFKADTGAHFIAKPYSASELAAKLGEIIGQEVSIGFNEVSLP